VFSRNFFLFDLRRPFPYNPTINVALPRKRKEARRPEEEPSSSTPPRRGAGASGPDKNGPAVSSELTDRT